MRSPPARGLRGEGETLLMSRHDVLRALIRDDLRGAPPTIETRSRYGPAAGVLDLGVDPAARRGGELGPERRDGARARPERREGLLEARHDVLRALIGDHMDGAAPAVERHAGCRPAAGVLELGVDPAARRGGEL